MNANTTNLKERGIGAAARYLARRGYDVLEIGWSCDAGEVDIIARDEDALVFVEVNTYDSSHDSLPPELATREKRARCETIALAFLAGYDATDVAVRFDILSITAIGEDRALLRHHIAAVHMA